MRLYTQIYSKLRILKQYGLKYSFERGIYTIQHVMKFSKSHKKLQLPSPISKEEWYKQKSAFIIFEENSIQITPKPNIILKSRVDNIFKGIYPYFQTLQFELHSNHKWFYNPLSKQVYFKEKHWTKIDDFSTQAGDIKFVWELSRFCYLYHIMRYDFHFAQDSSEFVFKEILDWVKENPNDLGPNYMSSQEIALRLLNWIYALNFYRNSISLSDKDFNIISNSIYLQSIHIENELEFSKKFVRNNHLLTEALALFTVGLQFPQFDEADVWKQKGYAIFNNEIEFQFDDDGAYLQHSFNYQRVAMQLATWFISLCKKNSISIPETVSDKLSKSVQFMLNMIGDKESGRLPQFGNNDGSLFFPLNDELQTNYYPQIQALANALNLKIEEKPYEDTFWFNSENKFEHKFETQAGISNNNSTGYYVIQEKEAMTFLWCPDLKHRPGQSDMLHCDIWYKGENIMRDNGTYLYNTSNQMRNYFFGSKSHNTIMIEGSDLMEKGERFVFFNWPKKFGASAEENEENYILTAAMQFFPKAKHAIVVNRKVTKIKNKAQWEIEDKIENSLGKNWVQIWNIGDAFLEKFEIIATDANKNSIQSKILDSFTSDGYGDLKAARQIHFSSTTHLIHTFITLK